MGWSCVYFKGFQTNHVLITDSQASVDFVTHLHLSLSQQPVPLLYDRVLGVRTGMESSIPVNHNTPGGTLPKLKHTPCHRQQCSAEVCSRFVCVLYHFIHCYIKTNHLSDIHAQLVQIQNGLVSDEEGCDVDVSDNEISIALNDIKVLRYFHRHVKGLSHHIEFLCEEYCLSQQNLTTNIDSANDRGHLDNIVSYLSYLDLLALI